MNITFLFHITCVHVSPKERLHKYLRSAICSSYFGLFISENCQLQSNFMRWPVEQPRSFICVFVAQEDSNPRTWKQTKFSGKRLNFQAAVCISPGSMCNYACINYMVIYLPTRPCISCPKESTISKHGLITTPLTPIFPSYVFFWIGF